MYRPPTIPAIEVEAGDIWGTTDRKALDTVLDRKSLGIGTWEAPVDEQEKLYVIMALGEEVSRG